MWLFEKRRLLNTVNNEKVSKMLRDSLENLRFSNKGVNYVDVVLKRILKMIKNT